MVPSSRVGMQEDPVGSELEWYPTPMNNVCLSRWQYSFPHPLPSFSEHLPYGTLSVHRNNEGEMGFTWDSASFLVEYPQERPSPGGTQEHVCSKLLPTASCPSIVVERYTQCRCTRNGLEGRMYAWSKGLGLNMRSKGTEGIPFFTKREAVSACHGQ